MTTGTKEWIGIGAGAGVLAALYALQKSGGIAGLTGLGRLGQTAPQIQILDASLQPVAAVAPGSYYYVRITGLNDKTDWVEGNFNNVMFAGNSPNSGLCANGGCTGYNNTLPLNWKPVFSSRPDPTQYTASLYNLAELATQIIGGQWLVGATSPQKTGTYTLQVAIDGQIQSVPLVVSGNPGAYTGGGIAVGTAVPGAAAGGAVLPTALTAPVAATTTAGTQSGATPAVSAAGASGAAASQAIVQMLPATATAAAGSGITGVLEQSYFGFPLWVLLAVAAGGLWYFTKER